VRVIIPPYNLGFQEASNLGVAESKWDIVVLLNNDMIVSQDSLPPLVDHFRNDDVFSVSSRLFMWDGVTFLAGKRKGVFEKGYFKLVDVPNVEETSPTLFTTGGAGAFHRRRFLELQGFDRLYHPAYWEDIDLCYRAWKRGWRSLYEPKSVMYHKHRATIGKKMKSRKLSLITGRNSYLFLWKNITDRDLFLKHLLVLPISLLKDLVKFKMRFPICFALALLRLSKVAYLRIRERKGAKLTDKEVLKIIEQG
jgi:GT2 family glycosyltransferase